jgi:hypothetical protein
MQVFFPEDSPPGKRPLRLHHPENALRSGAAQADCAQPTLCDGPWLWTVGRVGDLTIESIAPLPHAPLNHPDMAYAANRRGAAGRGGAQKSKKVRHMCHERAAPRPPCAGRREVVCPTPRSYHSGRAMTKCPFAVDSLSSRRSRSRRSARRSISSTRMAPARSMPRS